MKMEHEHTNLPWKWDGRERILKPDGTVIATTNWFKIRESFANAEFIVQACNNHASLLEACRVAYNALGGNATVVHPEDVNFETIACIREWLSAAIAKAQKGE